MALDAIDDEFGELYGDLADNLVHSTAFFEATETPTFLGVENCLESSGESSESEDDLRIVLNDDDYVDDGDDDVLDDDLVVVGGDAITSSDRKPSGAFAGLKASKPCGSASQSAVSFYLPRNRTIFDVCIESFDQKPWRQQGVDVSDYFNFGMDEEGWKSYCESMEMLRQQAKGLRHLSTRRPSKHRGTTRSLRSEAFGGCWAERMSSVMEHIDNRSPGMTRGRPIQVESGLVERISSMDLRCTRLRDPDVVIQIPIEHSAVAEAVPSMRDLEHSDQDKIKGSVLNSDSTSQESILADTECRQYSSILCNREEAKAVSKDDPVGDNLKLDHSNCNGEGSSKLEPCDAGSPANQAIFSVSSDFDHRFGASESYDLKNELNSAKIVSSESITSSTIKSSFGCLSDSDGIGGGKSHDLEVSSRKYRECRRSKSKKMAYLVATPLVDKEGSEFYMELQNDDKYSDFDEQRETSVDYKSRRDFRRHKENSTKAFDSEDNNKSSERIFKKRDNLHLGRKTSFWNRRKEDMPSIGTEAKHYNESSPRYRDRRLQAHANGSPLIYQDHGIRAHGNESLLRCRDNGLPVMRQRYTICSGEEEKFYNKFARGSRGRRKTDEGYSGLPAGTNIGRENGKYKTRSFGDGDHCLLNYNHHADDDEGQHTVSSPRRNSTISWRSCEQYLDEQRLFSAKQKSSWRKNRGHNSYSYNDSHHCAWHEYGIELQYHKHLSDERNVYLEKRIFEKKGSDLHRRCQLISKFDDGFFRHQETIVFATADSLCGSARNSNNCVNDYLLSDNKYFEHNPRANGRERMIMEDNCHSDCLEDSRFVFNNFGKRRHGLRTLGRKEAVNMHLNGVKRKFFNTFDGSTVGKRPCAIEHRSNEAVKTMHIASKTELTSCRRAYQGRPAFPVNIETGQALQLKHPDHYRQRKTQDKARSMDNYEDDEIEEGQLIEEGGVQETGSATTKKLSLGKEMLKPASKARVSANMQVKKTQSKKLKTDEDKSRGGDNQRLLEMLAKMEKRRERFKEPLAQEQVDGNDLKVHVNSSVMTTVGVMQQRPTRKRRWACS